MHRLVFTLVLCVSAVSAADLTGKWSGTPGPIFLIMKQDGDKLSGTAGTSAAEQVLNFDNGKVEGDHVTLHVGPFDFDLKIDGEKITGQCKVGDRTMPAVLKRVDDIQKRAATLHFEVASVKPAKPQPGVGSSMRLNPGRVSCSNVTLKKLLYEAYTLKDYQVAGPDWLNTEFYTIEASMPPDTSGEEVFVMLQNLLNERFRIAMHRESRETSVYALVIAKGGSKLKPVGFGSGSTERGPGHLQGTTVPIRNLVEQLSRGMDRPVLDMTGLKGVFNFTLDWAADSAEPTTEAASIFTAIQEQLGLKLEARKAPVEMLVVDKAERVPTGN